MIRILIADDHGMLRQGLKRILAEEFKDAQFGEAGTVAETLASLRQQAWTLLVLDIFMPSGGGLEVLREAAVAHPKLRTLVLSSAPEEQLAVRTLQAGAAGYLNKQGAAEELVLAVKKVLAGGSYVSSRLAERLARELSQYSAKPHERLSDREFQVLQLLVAGKPLKLIAAELSLSPKTISTFHTRILAKLHLRTDVDLVHYAIEHQLIERNLTSGTSEPNFPSSRQAAN